MRKKKNSKKKIVVFTVIISVVIAFGLYLKKNGNGEDEKTGFQFTTIKRGNIENIVSSTGTLSAVRTVEVGSQVSGIIDEIHVDYNSVVKQGQVLAVLDKTLFQVSVKDARAGVLRAKAKLAQAQAELKRNKPLYEKGHLSESEYLVYTTNAETARADVDNAEASLKRANTNLEYTTIRSPINGTVIERTVDEGQTIAASFQAPKLFLIAQDLTQMQIETNVDESDIGQIKKNMDVTFTVQSYPDKTFKGAVRQIRLQPTTIQNVVNYTVVVDAGNDNGLLLPGMTATVDFVIERKMDVLTVSNSALNFKPTMEMFMKYRQQMQEKMKNRNNKKGTGEKKGAGSGAMRPGRQLPEGMGTIFYLDEKGIPSVALVKKGATDGMMTEIVNGNEFKEGMQIITAYKSSKKEKNSTNGGGLFRPPGPPRR